MIGFIVFLIGLALASYGSYKVDEYDDMMGIRLGGYGSNVSWVWPYSYLCLFGFILCVISPFLVLV